MHLSFSLSVCSKQIFVFVAVFFVVSIWSFALLICQREEKEIILIWIVFNVAMMMMIGSVSRMSRACIIISFGDIYRHLWSVVICHESFDRILKQAIRRSSLSKIFFNLFFVIFTFLCTPCGNRRVLVPQKNWKS